MVDIDRVVTLDELMDRVPEHLVKDAESRLDYDESEEYPQTNTSYDMSDLSKAQRIRNYLESHPEIFHLPDHFRNYPYLCMWIHDYDMRLLREVLETSWRGLASKKQIMEWEKANNP